MTPKDDILKVTFRLDNADNCCVSRIDFHSVQRTGLKLNLFVTTELDDIVNSLLNHVGNFFLVTKKLLVCSTHSFRINVEVTDLAKTDGRYFHYSLERNGQFSRE